LSNNYFKKIEYRKSRKAPALKVDKALENTLRYLGIADKVKCYSFIAHWDKVMGESFAAIAKPIKIRANILTLSVSSAALMNELSFMKADILEKINIHQAQKFKILDIRFESTGVVKKVSNF